jgi:thiol-disulfide isomerase/thioredoxin
MMRSRLYTFLLLLSLPLSQVLGQGYEITVKANGFEGDTVQLGYFLMDKQYVSDTAIAVGKGEFTFQGEELLAPGMYFVVFPPDNQFLQFSIPSENQSFKVISDYADISGSVKFSGSPENEQFYTYLRFLEQKGKEAEEIKASRESLAEDQRSSADEALTALDGQVKAYQNDILANTPESMTALIIKSTREPEIPDFEGEKAEVDRLRFYYYRDHYFDNTDLSDPRLLRTPLLFSKVDRYIQKLTVQHPDSISTSLDRVLTAMEPAEETFKYYLVHYLNEYARSKFVGMDAVYVHLVNSYYATGKAPWTEEEQLTKIIDNAKTLGPLLLGRIAPNIALQQLDVPGTIAVKEYEDELYRVKTGNTIPLHQVDAQYTLLVFWDPDCGHCKKSMPKLRDFYASYKDKGFEIYAVCGRTVNESGMVKCAEYLQKNEMLDWLNMVDPYYRTKFKSTYDIKSTPQLYLLDKNKEILSKRFDAEQLEEILLNYMGADEKNLTEENESQAPTGAGKPVNSDGGSSGSGQSAGKQD